MIIDTCEKHGTYDNKFGCNKCTLASLNYKDLTSINEAFTTLEKNVDHPNYYGGNTTYEAIKVIDAWNLGFSLGNTIKYISRAGKKNVEKEIEDLEKARWYLDHYINKLRLDKK